MATLLLMQQLGLSERFLAVLAAVLIVQPSVGRTLGSAWGRVVATVVGCGLGSLCLWLLPDGWGAVGAMGVTMLIMNAVASLRPDWKYGVVSAVALAMGPGTAGDGDIWVTAWDRCVAIGLGSAVGAAVTLAVWPNKSETRARRHLDAATDALAKLIAGSLAREDNASADDDERAQRGRLARHLDDARTLAEAVRIADDDHLWALIRHLEDLEHAAVMLARLSESVDDATDCNGKQQAYRNAIASIQSILELLQGDAPPQDKLQAKLSELLEALEQLDTQSGSGNSEPQEGKQAEAVAAFLIKEVHRCLEGLATTTRKRVRSEG